MYLDASAIVPIFVREPRSQAVTSFVESLPAIPYLSNFGAGEVASAISRHVRMETFSGAAANVILKAFDQWSVDAARAIDVGAGDISRASMLVRHFDLKLRFPDALHLAVCMNNHVTLVTLDRKMAEAANSLQADCLLL